MCDDDKERFEFEFSKTRFGILQKDSKKESSSVVVDIETLGEQFFMTKFDTKRTSFVVIGKIIVVKIMMVKQ